MAYQVLTQDDMDETIVDYMKATERDLHCHLINVERYDAILLLDITPDHRSNIEGRRTETLSRIEEVQAIFDATVPQMPSRARIDGALVRIKAREERAR